MLNRLVKIGLVGTIQMTSDTIKMCVCASGQVYCRAEQLTPSGREIKKKQTTQINNWGFSIVGSLWKISRRWSCFLVDVDNFRFVVRSRTWPKSFLVLRSTSLRTWVDVYLTIFWSHMLMPIRIPRRRQSKFGVQEEDDVDWDVLVRNIQSN